MKQSPRPEQPRDWIDTDLTADELERLARVDALLRMAADQDRADASHKGRTSGEAVRPNLRLVTTPPATTGATRQRTDEQTYELKLTFGELALIYKSLQATKTLGALPPQDELLNDTIQLVDLAMQRAV